MGCDPAQMAAIARMMSVSVPFPGFNGLRRGHIPRLAITTGRFQSRFQDSMGCDVVPFFTGRTSMVVSVPFPGFNGLRRDNRGTTWRTEIGFSPVSRIQWVATGVDFRLQWAHKASFSPVSRIQWVAASL